MPPCVFPPMVLNAFASAVMGALIAATAAKAGFGSRAALPDMNTTEPFDCLSALPRQVSLIVVLHAALVRFLLAIARLSSRTNQFVALPRQYSVVHQPCRSDQAWN